jgi:uncharacterized protein YeaO (DUF488 family)
MPIQLKRIYENPDPSDGFRVLVERLWPRGVSKERAHLDLWLRDAGASPELRLWFGHDPARWDEFRIRYFVEMRERASVVKELKEVVRDHERVTFLYAAHDEEHNNALALKEFLEGVDPEKP